MGINIMTVRGFVMRTVKEKLSKWGILNLSLYNSRPQFLIYNKTFSNPPTLCSTNISVIDISILQIIKIGINRGYFP